MPGVSSYTAEVCCKHKMGTTLVSHAHTVQWSCLSPRPSPQPLKIVTCPPHPAKTKEYAAYCSSWESLTHNAPVIIL